MNQTVFEDLFVLDLANNHWGSIGRALKLISEYSRIVRDNNVRAAIKLQFRDVDSFIHKNYRHRTDLRYIKKTLDTQLSKENFRDIVKAIKDSGCIAMTTPFDEKSVDLADDLGVEILKIASSDINDWPLVERIAKSKKSTICSTGGCKLEDIDNLVSFFEKKKIPLAINHCISAYPTEDEELEMNQIDFLRNRYSKTTIGFSTHEYKNWEWSIMIAYAKGARTFERHIDIDDGLHKVPAYNSLPDQIDTWFKAFHKVKAMCGSPSTSKSKPLEKEVKYLDKLLRGVYAKRDLPKGHVISDGDFYLSIPLLFGQISCRELMKGEVLKHDVKADNPIKINEIESPYSHNEELKSILMQRGLNPEAKPGKDFNHGDQSIANIATLKVRKSS